MHHSPNTALKAENEEYLIKVIGIGGGGSNAVNYMFNQGIYGVDFIVCNTDRQALQLSPVPKKLQIGEKLTQGLGAGANPEIGKKAALESEEEIRDILKSTKMLFITAGMGGGTGTGAAPVIASIAKELDILTVGIVTLPFSFEGKPKTNRAEKGIAELKPNCDTVLQIINNKIKELYGKASIGEAFAKADMILCQASSAISDIVNVTGMVNVDFEDVKTVVNNAGSAVMGTGIASGDNKAIKAVEQALTSPLLNNTNIEGSKYILLSIKTKDEDTLQIEEIQELTDYLQTQSGEDTEIIWGLTFDPKLDDNISVTIIATGFDEILNRQGKKKNDTPNLENQNIPQIPKNEVYLEIENSVDHEIISNNIDSQNQIADKKYSQQVKNNILLNHKQSWENIQKSKITNNEDIKEKQEIPAYKRRGVQLYNTNKLEDDKD